MCAAWELLQKHCFATSLLFWLTFIIFKINRMKAVLKIFKCSFVLRHMLVFWYLPVSLLQCYNRRKLIQNYSFNDF